MFVAIYESGLPITICCSEADLFEGKSPTIRAAGTMLLETNMYIYYFQLQVVNDLPAETCHHAVLLLLLLEFANVGVKHFGNLGAYSLLLDSKHLLPLLRSCCGFELYDHVYVVQDALDRHG